SALDIMTHQRPDLVLSDLMLPDTNGFDLLKALREQPNASGVPILAFTGLLSHDEEGRALAVGFDGFIPKPVEPAHLRHVVRGHLPVPSTERRRFGAGKRLIVADDDATQLKLAKYRLGKVGFEVEAVSDGIEALNAARRRKPDVIVTDALMPRLDGFGVCLGVRQDETLSDVPVVLLTSSYVEQEDRLLATRAGANAFVVRTADLAEVIGVLEKMMQTPGGAGASSSPTIARAEIDSVRSHRALQQLERQVSLNSGLMQRCSTLSAELSILTTVAEALVDMRDVEGALVEILANCLDVAGAARGAIYARELGGALTLKAQHGFGADLTLLDNALCDGKLLARAEASEELIAVEALGKGGLAVPLRGRGETFGLLVLDAPAGAPKEDWRPFAVAIASQVSLALALARSFADSARSEARTRALMAHANDAIFVSTPDGRVVEANRAAETLLRRAPADIVGRPFRELFTREDGAPPLTATTHLRELLARREDGALVPVQVSSNPVDAGDTRLVMAIARDVSEQRALETRLRQAQKMEAIGRLAGGVAHDFNNMLSVILSYSDLLLGDLKKDDPIAADLAEIKKAGERAADLTRQLLAFSRQQVLQSRVLGVNDVVVGMEKMAKRLIGEDI
ncbi:MAG TPA: response regulator, partial [Byssovorax sp.]